MASMCCAGGEAGALVGLGHQVADVDAQGRGAADGFGDSVHQQVGDAAGEQRAGADADDVGLLDGVERLGQRTGVGRDQAEARDAAVAGGDFGFAADALAVAQQRLQLQAAAGGGGIDFAAGFEDDGAELDGLGEVAADIGQRGEKEVAEAVAVESAAGEAVAEQLRQQLFIVGERRHAVADVAGRGHALLLAQASAGAAVVGDGDDGGEAGDEGRQRSRGRRSGDDVALESAEQGGQAGAAADGNDAESLAGMVVDCAVVIVPV